jgi:L-methionine (R)-S-oxide reductase
MAEMLTLADKNAGKKERYEILLPQLQSLVEGEPDLIANLANIIAAIKESMQFFWIGFYFTRNDELVLGPFQGPVACTRIKFGKGVCGTAWKEKKVIIVDDVDLFPGHIACSTLSRSEIVLPVFNGNNIELILDIDSDTVASFDAVDEYYLLQVAHLIESLL